MENNSGRMSVVVVLVSYHTSSVSFACVGIFEVGLVLFLLLNDRKDAIVSEISGGNSFPSNEEAELTKFVRSKSLVIVSFSFFVIAAVVVIRESVLYNVTSTASSSSATGVVVV